MNSKGSFKVEKMIKSTLVFSVLALWSCFSWIVLVECGRANVDNEGFYKLLGVSKTATTKEIRMAFKKLALAKHPDKNQDDPNANELFVRINRAYETLKDDDLRKKYDMYGEEGLKDNQNNGQNYQSWNFYNQNFGIYDEDPEIVTLTRSDFMQFVDSNTDTIWFVNFYSTQCSHCHELAPTWRELAKKLDGVVKIGAVNCMDDWHLCNMQQIQSFPSLIMFPIRAAFYEEKTIDNLLKFALSFTSGRVHTFTSKESYKRELNKDSNQPWLVSYCLSNKEQDDSTDDESELNYELNCLDDVIKDKLAIMLHGLVNVASIDCSNSKKTKELCAVLKPHKATPLVYYESLPNIFEHTDKSVYQEHLLTANYKSIVESILSYLPGVKQLDAQEFDGILGKLRDKTADAKPLLVQFINGGEAASSSNEYKRLPSLLGAQFQFAQFDCAKVLNTEQDCRIRFQLFDYPKFVLFKSIKLISANLLHVSSEQDWYEIYYSSRQSPQDLSKFVKDNAYTCVRTLKDFTLTQAAVELMNNEKTAYLVDFFAPWCPPCMNLLPEFRKSSKLATTKTILYGTVDCTVNQQTCERFGVRSYPTTILFNQSVPHNYLGHHLAEDIGDFVQDILSPVVITLTYDTFHSLVGSKPKGKLWLVDFYASWCGPCQQLAPEWRKMAKKIDANVGQVGQVDCVAEPDLCAEQGVQSYPNIRVYTADHEGFEHFEQFQGWMRDAQSLFLWANEYLPSKVFKLNGHNFEHEVLENYETSENDQPWLVDFYAPWCGHCNVFAPTFEALAAKLEGRVKLGKVNCQFDQYLCQLTAIRGFPTIRFYPVGKANWNSGEDIELYDFDSILKVLNAKLKRLGYHSKEEL